MGNPRSRRLGGILPSLAHLVFALWMFALAFTGIPMSLALAEDNPAAQITGKWTYRSFHNRTEMVTGDPNTALSLFFAEAVFSLHVGADNKIGGTIDWPGGGLELQGTLSNAADGVPLTVQIVGTGRPGTQTENWEYDYFGYLAHVWPQGEAQVPAIVGSVLRAKPHGGAPAGYVASFVAVKQ